MFKSLTLIFQLLFFSGCELIIIGTDKKPDTFSINQNSALGAVFLFKAELDSNNVQAAAKILAGTENKGFSALEKYDLYYEIARIGRIISRKPVTSIRADTLSSNIFSFNVEFDYIKTIKFTTAKINDNWFIVNYLD